MKRERELHTGADQRGEAPTTDQIGQRSFDVHGLEELPPVEAKLYRRRVPGRLLSFRSSELIQQKRMVDIILMPALADGFIAQGTLDRLARAIQRHPELSGVSWDWVLARCDELALDAPLFSDTRENLSDQLPDTAKRRLGISLAVSIVGAGQPLIDDVRAILGELAGAFGIRGKELEAMLAPAKGEDTKGFVRATCNSQRPGAPTWAQALGGTKSDDETRVLMYKPYAIRRIIDVILPGAELVALCETFRAGLYAATVDAVLDLDNAGRCIVRCLAEDEALHPEEHRILGQLAGELKELSFLMIAHQDSIPLMDQAFLKGLDSTKLRVEKVDIWEGVT
jgi:hypothetical protein